MRFHNPNTTEDTIKFLTKIFVEVNMRKLERVLQEEMRDDDLQKEKQTKMPC